MNIFSKKTETKTISANYMDIVFVPAKDKKYNIDEKGIVTVDVANTGFYMRLAQKLWHKPTVSHISLDEYGSLVFISLDGINTVNDVLQIMYQRFPDEKDRMLDRVITFFHTLETNGFIKMTP